MLIQINCTRSLLDCNVVFMGNPSSTEAASLGGGGGQLILLSTRKLRIEASAALTLWDWLMSSLLQHFTLVYFYIEAAQKFCAVQEPQEWTE